MSSAIRWATLGGATTAGLAWLGWRVTTLDGPAWGWCVAFFLAEAFLFASTLGFDHLIACEPSEDPSPPPMPDPPPSVDVLIPTLREPVALLAHTVRAARDMALPHRTVVCDDGDRPEVRELCARLGVDYLARPDRRHFKAGNLNHALAHTRGELVLVLDADHVPRRQMLARMVPHMRDPDVGFVQIPQVYYNADSVQHVCRGRSLWHESTLFHHRLQRGAGALGTALCVGTGVLFRRTALHRAGGFATETVTEDVHTSLRIHALGYRSVYVHEALGVLLAPDTPKAYATQRLRWTQGAMQVLRVDNPLWARGLTPRQRAVYLAGLGSFLQGWPTLALVLAPAVFVLLGAPPLHADPEVAVPLLVAHVGVDLALFHLLAGRDAHLFHGERLRMINLGVWLRGSLRLLIPAGTRFQVTPKERHRGLPAWVLATPLGVLGVNVATVVVASRALAAGSSPPGPMLVALAFALWFAITSGAAVLHLVRARDGHPAPRWAVPDAIADVVRPAVAVGPDGAVDADGAPVALPPSLDLTTVVFEGVVPRWLDAFVDTAPAVVDPACPPPGATPPVAIQPVSRPPQPTRGVDRPDTATVGHPSDR